MKKYILSLIFSIISFTAYAQQPGCTALSLTVGCYIWPQAVLSVPQILPNGSPSTPSIAFANATTTGMFLDTNAGGISGNLGIQFVINGSQVGEFKSGGNFVAIGQLYGSSLQVAGVSNLQGMTTVGGYLNDTYNAGSLTKPATFGATGLSVAWNYVGGLGETDFFLGPQGGSPGLNIYGLNSSGVVQQSASSPLWKLDNLGDTIQLGTAFVNSITSQNAITRAYPSLNIGNAGNNTYSQYGLITQNAPLALRYATMGCENQGAGFSVITNGTISVVGNGLSAPAGINGNCNPDTLSSVASYSSFASGTMYLEQLSDAAPITLNNVTYTTTTVVLSTALTTYQQSLLAPHQYILTNSIDGLGRLYASYLQSWTSTTLTVSGWTSLGSNNTTTGQLPSTTYLSGTPSSNTVYVGQPTNLFTTNEVCNKNTDYLPVVTQIQCSEIDVVNNSGVDIPNSSAASLAELSGISLLSLGANKAGNGLYIAGQNGYTTAFQNSISIANFGSNGIYLTQTNNSSAGGVGIEIAGLERSNSTPFNIQTATGTDVFTVNNDGYTTNTGGLHINGLSTNAGGYIISAQQTISGSVVSDFLVDSTGAAFVNLGMQAQSFQLYPKVAQPACNVSSRDTLWILQGTPDTLQICLQTATSGTYAWTTIVN